MNKLIFYENFKEGRKIYIRFNLIIIITFLMVFNLAWIASLIGGVNNLLANCIVNCIVIIYNFLFIYWTIYNLLWLAKYEIFAYNDKIIVRSVYKEYTIMLNEIKTYRYQTRGNLYKITIFLIDNRKHLFEFTKRKKVIYTTHYSKFVELLKNS